MLIFQLLETHGLSTPSPSCLVSPLSPSSPSKVPVLIFQLERNTAVLIDEHYNAKALEDMILVVQNAARE